jgi:hypothetical protein
MLHVAAGWFTRSSQMYCTYCISFMYHCTSSSSTQSTIIKQTSKSLQRKHSPRGGLPRSSKTQVYDLRTILRILNEKHDANNSNQQLRYKQRASWLLLRVSLLVEYISGFTRTGSRKWTYIIYVPGTVRTVLWMAVSRSRKALLFDSEGWPVVRKCTYIKYVPSYSPSRDGTSRQSK